MKKFIVTLLFCLIGSHAILFAQRNDEQRKADFEKFKIEREAFITKEMGLTEDEAKAFWPLSNELQKKKFELNKAAREQMRWLRKAKGEGRKIDDAEYKELVESLAKIRIKEAELDEEYIKKFLSVVSAEKVFKYQDAEREFVREMMDKREKRQHTH